jgi:hypothetical protein
VEAHACHSSYAGWITRRLSGQASLGINLRRTNLENKQKQKGLGHGSGGKTPV